jgi:hypothetical protein
MQNLDGYTTVTTWEKEKREAGLSVYGNWFRTEVREGRIPSITVVGRTLVKATDLQAAWPIYQSYRAYRIKARDAGLEKARAVMKARNDDRDALLAEIDRKLTRVIGILEA